MNPRSIVPASVLFSACCASVLAAQTASAQDSLSFSEPPLPAMSRDNTLAPHLEKDLRFRTRGWSLEIQPGAWFAATRGDVRLPSGRTFLVEDLNFDSVEFTPTLETRLRFGDWQVDANLALFRYDDDARVSEDADLGKFTIARGDRMDVRLDYTHLHLKAGKRIWTANLTDGSLPPFDDGTLQPATGINIDLELFGGVRFIDYDLRMKALTGGAAGQRVSVSESWFQPTLGGAVRIDFENRLTIDAIANIGGWYDSSATAFSFDITASAGYAITNNVQLDLGYRYIHNSYDKGSDDFEISGSVAGLFAALTFRF